MHHPTREDGSKGKVVTVTETAPNLFAVSLEALAVKLEAGGFSAPYAVHTRRS